MLHALLDLVFPRRSIGGVEGAWITDDERGRMRLTPALLATPELRKRGLTHIDAVVAAGSYDASPLLRKAILTFKFKRASVLGEDLAGWMTDAIRGLLLPPKFLEGVTPILCPVPLHWTRKFHRGFNQADILAAAIGRTTSWPVLPMLSRVRPTGHQTERQRAERLTALTGAFRYDGTGKAPRYVILVDDLCTTGATLEACAKTLKRAGTEHVAALVTALG